MSQSLKLFLDEHLNPVIAQQLRLRGIDAVATREVGRAGRGFSDAQQLSYATDEDRVIVTNDRDFVSLSITGQPHAGIAMLQNPMAIGEIIEYLEVLANVMSAGEMRNRLLYCDW